MRLDNETAFVFNGFLKLKNLDKLTLVEAINEYFDSNDRESIRSKADQRFIELIEEKDISHCTCCGRLL